MEIFAHALLIVTSALVASAVLPRQTPLVISKHAVSRGETVAASAAGTTREIEKKRMVAEFWVG